METILRYDFLEHVSRVLYATVLIAELGYFDADILVADELLLEDVFEKDEYDPHPTFLGHVVALAGTLIHAFLNEQMREFVRNVNMEAQAIKT